MSEKPQFDDLDALLSQSTRAEVPAWFEAKTMARMRREREQVSEWEWFANVRWLLGGSCVAALLLVAVIFWNGNEATVPEGAQSVQEVIEDVKDETDDSLLTAIEAFSEYSEEEEMIWLADASL